MLTVMDFRLYLAVGCSGQCTKRKSCGRPARAFRGQDLITVLILWRKALLRRSYLLLL